MGTDLVGADVGVGFGPVGEGLEPVGVEMVKRAESLGSVKPSGGAVRVAPPDEL